MRSLLVTLSALAAVGFVTLASAEQVYKWKDANGVWQYSNRPPPKGTQVEKVNLRSAPEPTQVEAAPASPQTPQSAQAADLAKRKAEACERARKNVEIMRANSTVSIDRDGDGIAEQQLDSAQTAEQLRKAEAQVTLYCEAG
jgi:hypothetical protein